MPESFAHPQPDRGSRYLNLSDFLDVTITGGGLKSRDFQSHVRLIAASFHQLNSREKVVLHSVDQRAVYPDPPTAGAFLIRSPPSVPTL